MFMDDPNTLIQTNMPQNKYGKERVIMKIICVLVEILVKLDSDTYRKNVEFENGKIVICVVVLREIYGMIVDVILLYKNFCGDLENLYLSSILTIHVSLIG